MMKVYQPLRVNVWLFSRAKSPLDADQGVWEPESAAHNIVTTRGKELVAAMLAEETGRDTGITYCEIGTGTNVPSIADVALQTALTRKAITRYIRASNVVQFRAFYPAVDATANIKEAGLFGHSTATATIGTGDLFNRAAVAFDNTAGSKDLTIVIEVTFG